jgi:type IV secretion system protein VirD4
MALKTECGPPRKKSKTSSKTRYAVSAVALIILIIGLQWATQSFAKLSGYQSALGEPFWINFYPFWSIILWGSQWYKAYPDIFMRALAYPMTAATIAFIVVVLGGWMAGHRSQIHDTLHGSARWARKKDIEKAGLLGVKELGQSVIVGGWEDKSGKFHYLKHSGPEHILCYAPTRSGKGVGLVVPTLLSWTESCVVTDLKGELWALTSGWRGDYANNKVIRFEPASSEGSAKWNPLDEIRINTDAAIGDIQNLAALIVDPEGKGFNDHWTKTAFALLTGVICYAILKSEDTGIPATLPGIDYMLADPDRPVKELWEEMSKCPIPVVATAGRDMLDRPDDEGGSVLSTTKSFLSLYRDPVVAENVSQSDFSIPDLMQHDNAVSLFIVTSPDDKLRLKPLVRIMISMIIRKLAGKVEFENGRQVKNYKHKLLLMLDEFPALGKIEILQESLAFLAGYGIRAYLICQDINQLKSREAGYGHDETITSNCHVQNAYPPNRIETAEHLSKLTGTTTIVKEQITSSGKKMSAVLGQVSKSYQEIQRPLITPDECQRMQGPEKDGEMITKAGDMIVYVAGYPAIYGKQALYFKDPIFQARSQVPAPETSDTIIDFHESEQELCITCCIQMRQHRCG